MDAPKPVEQALNDSRSIRLAVPKEANAIRVLTGDGKRAVVLLTELNKSPLYRAGPFVTVEAGKLDRDGFRPVRGRVGVK